MRVIKIQTEPVQFLNNITFECKETLNEHSVLKMSGMIEKQEAKEFQKLAGSELWVQVKITTEDNQESVFFHGVLTRHGIKMEGDVYELEIELKSGSYLLDLIPHTRAYQNGNLTYEEVLAACLKKESGMFIEHEKGNEAIGTFFMQYQETDWAFLKRLASHASTFLIPESTKGGKKIYFGFQAGQIGEITAERYVMENKSGKVCCVVESRELYQLGWHISFLDRVYRINEVKTTLKSGELYHTYSLILNDREWYFGKSLNKQLHGLSLKSNIIKVERDRVQVLIQNDELLGACGQRWFPYATVYSAPDGTGWYCMPEIGDEVRLTFPEDTESGAYVASSVHLETSGGRINPDEKSWKNKQQKEILFTPNSLILRNNAGLSIELLDEQGIIISSDKKVRINSLDDVQITSQTAGVLLSARDEISLKQKGAKIEIADDINISGGKILMN